MAACLEAVAEAAVLRAASAVEAGHRLRLAAEAAVVAVEVAGRHQRWAAAAADRSLEAVAAVAVGHLSRAVVVAEAPSSPPKRAAAVRAAAVRAAAVRAAAVVQTTSP